MILRRLADAIQEQNWFTVFVELILIVAGVFLGIQVSNWNEGRIDRQQEIAILGRLTTDFRDIETSLLETLTNTATRIQSLHDIAEKLGEVGGSDKIMADMPVLIDATQVESIRGGSPTYEELLSSSTLGLLQSEKLRDALGGYAKTYGVFDGFNRTSWDVTLQNAPRVMKISALAYASSNAPKDGGVFKQELVELLDDNDLVVEIGGFIATQKYLFMWANRNLRATRAVLHELGQEPEGDTEMQLVDDVFGAN